MRNMKKVILYSVLCAGLLVTFTPFLYMITTSLTKDTYALPYPPTVLPHQFYYENYIEVWQSNNFNRYFLNSFFVAITTMICNVFISSLTAYGFAKFKFPLKEFIFKCFIISMMVPGILNIIPQFTVIQSLGLVDTYTGLIILYVGSGIAGSTFFLRGFFEGIPKELEESVTIDGGSRWTIFHKIVLPLAAPSIGTFSIFAFSGAWDEFFAALTIIKTEAKRTLPIALRMFEGKHASDYGLIFAASIIAVTPIILVFIIFQKQLVRGGISDGSIKG